MEKKDDRKDPPRPSSVLMSEHAKRRRIAKHQTAYAEGTLDFTLYDTQRDNASMMYRCQSRHIQ